MTTNISDLQNGGVGRIIRNQYDSLEDGDNVPQATLQRAPPMRYGQIDNYATHQTVESDFARHYPKDNLHNDMSISRNSLNNSNSFRQRKRRVNNSLMTINGIFGGLYDRIKEPIIITILFVLFAHRRVAKGINPYLPLIGTSPSTDYISLITRGFLLGVLFLILRNKL